MVSRPRRLGRPQAGQDAGAVPVGADAECDVRGLGQVADLVREDPGDALALRHAGDGGDVGGQRDRRERALADDHGMDELDGDVLRVRARPAGAERDQLPALVEPHGHGVAGIGHRPGLVGEVPDRCFAQLEQAPGPAVARRGGRR